MRVEKEIALLCQIIKLSLFKKKRNELEKV